MSLSDVDEGVNEIYNMGCQVEALFEDFITGIPEEDSTARLFIEYQQRFATCTANLGVFARESQSLDRRLRNAPEMKDLMLQILHILRQALTQVKSSWEENSAQEKQSQDTLMDAAEAVELSLSRLNHLGVTIRQSSRDTLATRVNKFASALDLRPFEELCFLSVQVLYPNAPKALRDRLSRYMTDQFATVLFSKSRSQVLKTRRQEPRPDKPAVTPVMPTIVENEQVVDFGKVETRVLEHPVKRLALSQSDHSSLDTKKLKNLMKAPGSRTNKTSSIHIGHCEYPPPPVKGNAVNNNVLCEWCSKPIMQEDLEPNKWRRHVDQDLRPYICLSEGCKTDNNSYPRFGYWYEHMVNQHGIRWHMEVYKPSSWLCALCDDSEERFLNSQTLLEHMEEVHENQFTPEQMQTISRQSQTQVPRAPGECPLCTFKIEKLPAKKPTSSTKRHSNPPRGRDIKITRLNSGMKFPGPHDPSSSLSGSSYAEVDGEAGGPEPAEVRSETSKEIARHISAHLQTLMLLTMRLVSLQNTEEGQDDAAGSDSVEIDGENLSQDLSNLSDIRSDEDIIMQDDSAELVETNPPAITEVKIEDMEPTFAFDVDVDWSNIPLSEQVPVTEDLLLQDMSEKKKELTSQGLESLDDLRPFNPMDTKRRIEQTILKDGLQWDTYLYRWIWLHADFQRWKHNDQSRILWIKGEPGQGKTTILCGIINGLEKLQPAINISYFFCQATDLHKNNVRAVLQGLIYLLLDQNRSLLYQLRGKFDKRRLLKETLSLISPEALMDILADILKNPNLRCTYLIIDALDECVMGLSILLDIINNLSIKCPTSKWIISSRQCPIIETVSLEPNKRFTVATFIEAKVDRLLERNMKSTMKLYFVFDPIDYTQPQGMFDEVWKVEVDPLYLDQILSEQQTILGISAEVAIKRLIAQVNYNDELSLAYKAWEEQVTMLKEIRRWSHPHIVETLAVLSNKSQRYLMVPCADGGTLLDFLEQINTSGASLDIVFVMNIVEQLAGLASAVETIHGQGYWHYYLKPENILVFKDKDKDNRGVGTWKVANMGLTEFHVEATGKTIEPTTTMLGTLLYDAPEYITDKDGPRSPVSDIWSMGCIILQLVGYLLYGKEEVIKLSQRTETPALNYGSIYWEASWTPEKQWIDATVHRQVIAFINQIHGEFGDDTSTIGTHALVDLALLVRDSLLVVSPTHRINASELRSRLQMLHEELKQQLLTTSSVSLQLPEDPSRPIPISHTSNELQLPGLILSKNTGGDTHPPLDYKWEFLDDSIFARKMLRETTLFSSIETSILPAAKLCDKCSRMDFCAPLFIISDSLFYLKNQSMSCEFCRLRWDTCKQFYSNEDDLSDDLSVTFDRVDSSSHLRLNQKYPPALTILHHPELEESNTSTYTATNQLQIGLPELPTINSSSYFELLRNWVHDCDENHPQCTPTGEYSPAIRLPTRLIDVGTQDSPSIRLYETSPQDNMSYTALSHPWGTGPHFCTFPKNLASLKNNINFKDLPATFQDAIRVTRELGLQFLWIDSICIINGPDGDFYIEASRMEDIFSQAYCILAATSASKQTDGFLKPRQRRQCLNITSPYNNTKGGSIYVCEFIDDFELDVLGGQLHQGGWALQERALARRTIYFAGRQTYWECGDGIRCETMTKMQNKMESFLGDPAFPKTAVESSRGGRITLYQDLYARYSRLQLRDPRDRPIAIAGLEKRLIQSLHLRGGFGILDDARHGLLRRSLLWRRGSDEIYLQKIDFNKHGVVASTEPAPPTWSWMAYMGAIEYLNLPFDQIEWEEKDLISPWSNSPIDTWSYSREILDSPIMLDVFVRQFDTIKAFAMHRALYDANEIVLDNPVPAADLTLKLKCVLLGWTENPKLGSQDKRVYFVLLVTLHNPQERRSEFHVYNREGVGIISASLIHWDREGQWGKIR